MVVIARSADLEWIQVREIGGKKGWVKRGSVRITITESGELRAEHQATINASNDKRMIWLAPEGEWVKEGDVYRLYLENTRR